MSRKVDIKEVKAAVKEAKKDMVEAKKGITSNIGILTKDPGDAESCKELRAYVGDFITFNKLLAKKMSVLEAVTPE